MPNVPSENGQDLTRQEPEAKSDATSTSGASVASEASARRDGWRPKKPIEQSRREAHEWWISLTPEQQEAERNRGKSKPWTEAEWRAFEVNPYQWAAESYGMTVEEYLEIAEEMNLL